MTRRLEGAPVAAALLAEARARLDAGTAGGARTPRLVSVHPRETSPFALYLRQQAKTASEVGVRFTDDAFPKESTTEALVERLRRWNADPDIDAILLQHPLPHGLDFGRAVAEICSEKDVDGVARSSLGRLVGQRPIQAPAVARAAFAILRHYGIPIVGRRAAVVGRSETVGLPLALLLLARGEGGDATVTVAHSKTPDLGAALAGCEVIFTCAGRPGLLTREIVPRGAVVIDIGLSTVPDPSRPSGVRPAGDADWTSLDGWAEAATPVPGGVGPVTAAQLMRNVVHGWELLRAAAGP